MGAESDRVAGTPSLHNTSRGIHRCFFILPALPDFPILPIFSPVGASLEVLFRTPLHKLGLEQLTAEKHTLKRRLRSFDARVCDVSGCKPSKEDKRHLRPLYLRLAYVKQAMAELEQK